MMNRKLCMASVVSVLLLMSACSLFSSPSRSVKKFYQHLEAGELDDALKLMSKRSTSTMGPDKTKAFLSAGTHAIKEKGGISSVDIEKETITGEVADVNGTIKYKNGTSEPFKQSLVKEDGTWKLDSK